MTAPILLPLAASFGIAVLHRHLRSRSHSVWAAVLMSFFWLGLFAAQLLLTRVNGIRFGM